MGTGFARKKKEARLMQQQLGKLQNDMQNLEVTGQAANGLISLTLTGDGALKSIKIKPEVVDRDDVEGLELLIKTAFADAFKQLQEAHAATQQPYL